MKSVIKLSLMHNDSKMSEKMLVVSNFVDCCVAVSLLATLA